MISYLNKAKSLGNLYRAEIGGQVATILLFMIVVVLVLVMFTVNIGNLSLSTTVLSNAVDQASLYLASELSTRSRILFETLGNDTKYCKKRGLVAFVGSLLLGPLGGALGGLIDGSGFWEGLSQGFFTAIRFAGALIIGANFAGWIGAAIMAAIDIGAEIYNYVKNDHAAVHGMRQIAENISKLDLATQYREETYYRVLSQIVDDPNMFPDDADEDGDGNRKELVNAFEDFFFWRTEQLAENFAYRVNEAMRRFIIDPNAKPGEEQGKLKKFRDFAEKEVSLKDGKPGGLARCEFTCPHGTAGTACLPFNHYDGDIIYLARGLDKWGMRIEKLWLRGTPAKYCKPGQPWVSCPSSDAHDSIDMVTATFTTLIADADEKIYKILGRPGNLSEIGKLWPEWISIFYYWPGDLEFLKDHGSDTTEESDKGPGGYYFQLGNLIDCNMGCEDEYLPMNQWQNEMQKKKDALTQVCHTTITDTKDPNYGKCLGPATIGSKPCNVPCCINNNTVCTVDPILDDPDEFVRAKVATQKIIDRMGVFRNDILEIYRELLTISIMEDKSAGIDGGGNPMIYLWNDARCPGGKNDFCHSVRVDILDSEGKNAINVPYLKYTKNWREACLKLRNGAGYITVRVTRQDPSNVMVGILGKWNPFSGRVVRQCKSGYNWQAPPWVDSIK